MVSPEIFLGEMLGGILCMSTVLSHTISIIPPVQGRIAIVETLQASLDRLKFERVLTAARRMTSSMLYSAQGSIGACIMDVIALVVFIISIFLAGRIAEHRGRSFKIWAWIAAFIGPLALPLVFLFPNLHGKNGDHARGF
jgi:hypothetical protein